MTALQDVAAALATMVATFTICGMATAVSAWLLTHRQLGVCHGRYAELIWRGALLAPTAAALAAVTTNLTTFGPRQPTEDIREAQVRRQAPPEPLGVALDEAPTLLARAWVLQAHRFPSLPDRTPSAVEVPRRGVAPFLPLPAPEEVGSAGSSDGPTPIALHTTLPSTIAPIATALGVAGLLAFLLSSLLEHIRFGKLLRGRVRVDTGHPAAHELHDLFGNDKIILSVHPLLTSPVAFGFGVSRREVCVPPSALDLPPTNRRAMLAHEAAHHRFGDPATFALVRGLRALFFWHPLPWLCASQLRRDAELRCDAWAAGRTDPLALARCLVDVAAAIGNRHSPLPAAGIAMAHGPREELEHRVSRLIDASASPPHPLPRFWLSTGALAFAGIVGLFGPRIVAQRRASQSSAASVSAEELGHRAQGGLPAAPRAPSPIGSPSLTDLLADLRAEHDTLRLEIGRTADLLPSLAPVQDETTQLLLQELDKRVERLDSMLTELGGHLRTATTPVAREGDLNQERAR